MKTKSLNNVLIILSLSLLVGFAISPPTLAADPCHRGAALGLSGTGAPYSKEALEGIELAVNEINARGGLLGKHPIKLFIRDTQTRPAEAVKVVKNLILKNRVQSIIGTYHSGCTLAITPICRENKVLHIATVSNSDNITKIDTGVPMVDHHPAVNPAL